MAVDQRKIDKMSSERVTPGNEFGDLTEVQNQVNAVNAERMNNLAQERIESQSVQETNTNLRTAVEIATDDSGNVVQQPQRTLPASSGNLRPETRALLANYGVNPNITETNNRKSTTNSSRNSTSRTSPGTGNVSNVTNINNVTNNTTNTETKVEIRKGGIETSTPQIPISVPQPQETNTAKFKAWLQNVFSKQNERYEINRREYDKKEYSLRRTSEKLMKKFGEVSKSVANRLDPSNMGKTFGSQMKVFVVLLGAMLLTKFWNPLRKKLNTFENDFRLAFGIKGGDTSKNPGWLGQIANGVKTFFGGDSSQSPGGAFISSIKQGFGQVIETIKLWFNDRATAVKKVLGDFDNDKHWYDSLNPISNALGNGIKKLAKLIGAAFGGIEGLSNNISNESIDSSKDDILKKERPSTISNPDLLNRKELYEDTDYQKTESGRSVLTNDAALAASNMSVTEFRSDSSNLNPSKVAWLSRELAKSNKEKPVVVTSEYLRYVLGLSQEQLKELISNDLIKPTSEYLQKQYKLKHVLFGFNSFENYDEGSLNSSLYGKDRFTRIDNKSIKGNFYELSKGALDVIKNSFNVSSSFDTAKELKELEDRMSDYRSKTYGINRNRLISGISSELKELISLSDENRQELEDIWNGTGKYAGRFDNAVAARKNTAKTIDYLRNPNNRAGGALDFIKKIGFDFRSIGSIPITNEQSRENAKLAMKMLMDELGLTDVQAAGLVGGFLRESNMNPGAVNPNRGATGIAQWLGVRKRAFERTLTESDRKHGAKEYNGPGSGKPLRDASIEDQIKYVIWELMNTHKKGLSELKKSDNIVGSSEAALGYYEFSAGPKATRDALEKEGNSGTWDGNLMKGIQKGNGILDLLRNLKSYETIPNANSPLNPELNKNLSSTQPTQSYLNSTIASRDISSSSNLFSPVIPSNYSIKSQSPTSSFPIINNPSESNSSNDFTLKDLAARIDKTNKLLAVIAVKPTNNGQGGVTVNNETNIYSDKKSSPTNDITRGSSNFG